MFFQQEEQPSSSAKQRVPGGFLIHLSVLIHIMISQDLLHLKVFQAALAVPKIYLVQDGMFMNCPL